jgi:flagellar motor switch protein FliG
VHLTGKQKAAMLLMTLDVGTASELLHGVNPDVVKDLAVEVAYLDAKGMRNSMKSLECIKEFCISLEKKPAFEVNDFLGEMLKSTVGDKQANHIQTQIGGLLEKKDPFISIRQAKPEHLAPILNNEHPQAAAVVLSELSPAKSSTVLGLLGEGISVSVVRRMASTNKITPEAKLRIAQMVNSQLAASLSSDTQENSGTNSDKSLRKVAVMLRNLSMDMRTSMLDSIKEKDPESAKAVAELMMLWEDITIIEDRSMQEALRSLDNSKLALALVNADEQISAKIKANISERAAATIDEEMSLMRNPKEEEINQARDEIVTGLRELNEKGELEFRQE